MDADKNKPVKQEANVDAGRWKTAEFRKKIVRKIMEVIIRQGSPSWAHNLSGLTKCVERFEEKVHASSKDEAEYIAKISTKVKALYSLPQNAESKHLFSNSFGCSEVFSSSGAGKTVNIEWQEQIYQKVQRIKSMHFTKLNALYHHIRSRLQQHESSPQEPKTNDLEKCRQTKQILEYIFAVLGASKSQINTDFKERLAKAEKWIDSIVHRMIISSHNQGNHSADVQSRQQHVPSQHSADVQSRQQHVPSHFRRSQAEIFEKNSSPQVLRTQNSHSTKQISQQNKMCLQEQQVAKQYSNSQQEANQPTITKGPGNAVHQQTHGAPKATEEFHFSINTVGISAAPLIEDCSNLNEVSHKPTLISDEPSAAMQRLIKALTSMSPEALSTSVGDIREVVFLNDAISTSELLGGPPKEVQQQKKPNLIAQGRIGPPKISLGLNLAPDINACSQARYLPCNDFVPTGRKMTRSINAMALDTSRICGSTSDNSKHFTAAEKPDLNSVTYQVKRPRIAENRALLEEIKEINKLLIDTEVVIGEENSIQSAGAAGGAAEHGEGLVVKFLFSAVTVNLNRIYAADKKAIIKPLWLLVPTSYPFSSPVILDKMPLEVSEDMKDLSMRAKSKLRSSLQSLNQPWSLGDIAMSWEHCAREAILEYAQHNGGGSFSSKYGGWEIY